MAEFPENWEGKGPCCQIEGLQQFLFISSCLHVSWHGENSRRLQIPAVTPVTPRRCYSPQYCSAACKTAETSVSCTTKHVPDTGTLWRPQGTDFVTVYSGKSGDYKLSPVYLVIIPFTNLNELQYGSNAGYTTTETVLIPTYPLAAMPLHIFSSCFVPSSQLWPWFCTATYFEETVI